MAGPVEEGSRAPSPTTAPHDQSQSQGFGPFSGPSTALSDSGPSKQPTQPPPPPRQQQQRPPAAATGVGVTAGGSKKPKSKVPVGVFAASPLLSGSGTIDIDADDDEW